MIRRVQVYRILSLLAMMITLCSLSTSLSGCLDTTIDKSLLTDDPCAAPCWGNITPGVSTEGDLQKELENNKWVKQSTLSSGQIDRNGIPVLAFAWHDRGRFLEKLKSAPNRAWVYGGRVALIEVYIDYDLSFGKVIAKFGPPEGVYATTGYTHPSYEVILDYPSKGLTFSSLQLSVDFDEICVREGFGIVAQDMKVTSVAYYAPTNLESMLSDVFMEQPDRLERMLQDEQPWQGFGEVKLAYYHR